jgi:hypothetical protein
MERKLVEMMETRLYLLQGLVNELIKLKKKKEHPAPIPADLIHPHKLDEQ